MRQDRNQSAFTLVELMVVIVIIGIMATVVTIKVNDYLITSKQNVARSEIAQIGNALELFFTENDRYPTNEEGLALLTKPTTQHSDGVLQGNLKDPWGHPYVYAYPGVHKSYDIVSYGANGLEGGTGADADIASWDLAGASGK